MEGERQRGERECKKAKVKYGGMVATNGGGKGAVIVDCRP